MLYLALAQGHDAQIRRETRCGSNCRSTSLPLSPTLRLLGIYLLLISSFSCSDSSGSVCHLDAELAPLIILFFPFAGLEFIHESKLFLSAKYCATSNPPPLPARSISLPRDHRLLPWTRSRCPALDPWRWMPFAGPGVILDRRHRNPRHHLGPGVTHGKPQRSASRLPCDCAARLHVLVLVLAPRARSNPRTARAFAIRSLIIPWSRELLPSPMARRVLTLVVGS